MIPVAADAEQALAMIRSHPDGTVVDVRDEEEYTGCCFYPSGRERCRCFNYPYTYLL